MDNFQLFALYVIGGLLLVQVIRGLIIEARLRNPRDNRVVYLEQVPHISTLDGSGPFLIRAYRQSGNLQQDDRIADDPSQAVKAAVSTLKRAGIPYVCVTKNSEALLCLRRPFHCHRGRAEGKKVGWVEVYDLSRRSPQRRLGADWALNAVLIVTVIALLGFFAWVWFRNTGS